MLSLLLGVVNPIFIYFHNFKVYSKFREVKPLFSERLKSLRIQHALSQKELGQQLFVSQQTIWRWETDKTTPNPEMLTRIAALFDVSIDFLLGHTDTEKAPPSNDGGANPELGALRDVMLKMTPEQRQELLRYAKYLAASEHNPTDAM